MQIAMLAVLGTVAALPTCSENNALQWSCYTVSDKPDEPRTLAGLATKLHVNPHRFAELNSLAQHDIRTWQVDAGAALRVPYGATCVPREGAWGCYEVQEDGETLDHLVNSSLSFWRSQSGLDAARAANARAMFNESAALFAGMHVRLPIAQCMLLADAPPATSFHQCFAVTAATAAAGALGTPPSLDDFAVQHSSTAAEVLAVNFDVLSNNAVLVVGMVLSVPRVQPEPPVAGCDPSATSSNSYWFCYTVKSGDCPWTIAQKFGVHPLQLCKWNSIDNCEQHREQPQAIITVGQVLALPGALSLKCTAVPGQIACWAYTGYQPSQKAISDDPSVFSLCFFYFDSAYSGGGYCMEDKAMVDILTGLNAWATPDLNVWIGMTGLAMPLRRCLPTRELECVTYDEGHSAILTHITGGNCPDGRPVGDDGCFFLSDTIRLTGENDYWWGNRAPYVVPPYVDVNGTTSGLAFATSSGTWDDGAPPPDAPMQWPTDTVAVGWPGCPDYRPAINKWCETGEPEPGKGVPSYCPSASVVPGSHFAYKVSYGDTMDDLDKRFGFDEGTLCSFNSMRNCSCLSTGGSWLKIPAYGTPPPAQLYKCSHGACVAGSAGVPLATCKLACGPTHTLLE
jgi:hypothetical protein